MGRGTTPWPALSLITKVTQSLITAACPTKTTVVGKAAGLGLEEPLISSSNRMVARSRNSMNSTREQSISSLTKSLTKFLKRSSSKWMIMKSSKTKTDRLKSAKISTDSRREAKLKTHPSTSFTTTDGRLTGSQSSSISLSRLRTPSRLSRTKVVAFSCRKRSHCSSSATWLTRRRQRQPFPRRTTKP